MKLSEYNRLNPETALKTTEMIRSIAESDLRLARKESEISVCQTMVGTISLQYNKETRTYRIIKEMNFRTYKPGDQPEELYSGKKKGCLLTLMDLYDVEL